MALLVLLGNGTFLQWISGDELEAMFDELDSNSIFFSLSMTTLVSHVTDKGTETSGWNTSGLRIATVAWKGYTPMRTNKYRAYLCGITYGTTKETSQVLLDPVMLLSIRTVQTVWK